MSPDLEERLSALLDGELPDDEAAALHAEIARSPVLAHRLAELAAVDEALRDLPARPVPADLPARLRARIRAEADAAVERRPRGAAPGRGPRGAGLPPRSRRRWLPAAVFAAAAAALVLLVLPRPRSREEATPAEVSQPEVEALARDLVGSDETSSATEGVPDEDLPVISVLDVLAQLDELEGTGSG